MLPRFAHKHDMLYVEVEGIGRRSRAKDFAIQVDL